MVWRAVDDELPVVVVGACGLDLVAHPQRAPQPGDRLPAEVRASWGGVASNVAANLVALGRPVRLISVVGQDPLGDALLRHLDTLGIDTRGVLRVPQPTGIYLGLLHAEGGLVYSLHDMRLMNALTPAHLKAQAALFRDAAAVFVDANLSRQALRTLFALAREAGLPVAADPTAPYLAAKLRPYLKRLGLVTPNHLEAAALLGRPVPQDNFAEVVRAARDLVAQGVQMAVITLAEFGVCYATPMGSGHLPALKTRVLDPTGAGDALTAATLFALLAGLEPDEAVRLGIAAASLTLQAPGTVAQDLSLERLYENLIL